MKNSPPAWSVFKRRLKERYQHLTDADLKELQIHWNSEQWLDRLHERVGGSRFAIAVLVEEATEAGKGWPVSTPLSLRRNLWA